jgi:hypothetical protein
MQLNLTRSFNLTGQIDTGKLTYFGLTVDRENPFALPSFENSSEGPFSAQ